MLERQHDDDDDDHCDYDDDGRDDDDDDDDDVCLHSGVRGCLTLAGASAHCSGTGPHIGLLVRRWR